MAWYDGIWDNLLHHKNNFYLNVYLCTSVLDTLLQSSGLSQLLDKITRKTKIADKIRIKGSIQRPCGPDWLWSWLCFSWCKSTSLALFESGIVIRFLSELDYESTKCLYSLVTKCRFCEFFSHQFSCEFCQLNQCIVHCTLQLVLLQWLQPYLCIFIPFLGKLGSWSRQGKDVLICQWCICDSGLTQSVNSSSKFFVLICNIHENQGELLIKP